MKLMIKYSVFIIVIPIIFLLSKNFFIQNWTKWEVYLTLLLYIINVIQFANNRDPKIKLLVQRLSLYLKHDATLWVFSSNYSLKSFDDNFFDEIIQIMKKNKCVINKKDKEYLQLFYNDTNLFNIRIVKYFDDNDYTLNVTTSKISVPIRKSKDKIREFSKLLEDLESTIAKYSILNKKYELDIDYEDKSPYFSFWLKKLPFENVEQFMCQIKIPNLHKEFVKVNKNMLLIKSDKYTTLFEIAENYILVRS